MLLVCPDCSHRYRVPDDRVAAGRVLRLACRNCGATIDSSKDRVDETLGDGPGWLLIIGDEARGPYDNRTLVALAKSRAFGPRDLIWRDGFPAWRVAGNTPPLGPDRDVPWWIKLDDEALKRAVAGLGQVLARRPEHVATRAGLERVLQAGRFVDVASAHLEAAFMATGQAARLVELLSERLIVTDDRSDRVELRRRIGQIYEGSLEDPRQARAAYEDARRDAAADPGLIEAEMRTTGALDDWAGAAERGESALALLDGEAHVDLRLRLARIYIDRLDDPARALTTIETLTDMPEARALRIELYGTLGDWTELAALYRETIAVAPRAVRIAALRDLADVQAGPLDDPEAASRSWIAVLDAEEGDPEAVQKLEGLLAARPDLEVIGDRLDRHYADNGQWSTVQTLRSSRAERLVDPRDKAAALVELAELARDRLDRSDAAFDYAAAAVDADPHTPSHRALHARLAMRAERTADWLDQTIARIDAHPQLIGPTVRALEEGLPRLEAADAERFYRAALSIDPDDESVWRALDPLLSDRPRAQIAHLEHRAAREEGTARRALLVRRAQLEADALDQPLAAYGTWGEILDAHPGDREALETRYALTGVLADPRRRRDAADALAGALPDSPDRQLELMRVSARLDREALEAPDSAIERWWAIAERAPGDPEALDALVDLCAARDDHAGLARALEAQRTQAEPAQVSALLRRLAELYDGPLTAPGMARPLWAELVEHEPEDVAALDTLERHVADEPDSLFEVHARRSRLIAPAVDLELVEAMVDLAPRTSRGDGAAVAPLAAAIEATGDDARLGPLAERLIGEAEHRGALIEAWERAAEAHAEPRAALHRRRGAWCRIDGRLDAANAAYGAALAIEPDHLPDWRVREALATDAERWTDAVEALIHIERLTPDAAERRAMARTRAGVQQDKLDDGPAAITAWRESMEDGWPAERAEALDALIELHAGREEPQALADALAERIELAGDAQRTALADRRARLILDELDRGETAIAAWEQALEYGADREECLAVLDELYGESGDVDGMLSVLDRQLEGAEGDARRSLLVQKAGLLQAFDRPDEAAAAWSEVLDDAPDLQTVGYALEDNPDDARLGPMAEALIASEGDYRAAIDAWQSATDAHPEQTALLARRRAKWWSAIGETEQADAAWAESLEHAPDHAPGWAARLALATEAERWPDAVSHLERLEALTEAPEARQGHIEHRARLLDAHLDDRGGAIEAVDAARALARARDDHEADRRLVDWLIGLHAADAPVQVDLLADRLALTPPDGRADLARRWAEAVATHRPHPAGADAWCQAIDHGVDPADAWARIDALHADAGDHGGRVEALVHRIELADGEERQALRRARARLLDVLDREVEAREAWETILIDAPSDLEALQAAWSARVADEAWGEVVALGPRLLGALPAGHPDRDQVLRTQAKALSGPLRRPADGAGAWTALLTESPDDPEALDALEAAYTALDEPAALVAILGRLVQIAEQPADRLRVERLRRIATLRQEALGDVEGALDAFDALLLADPTDAMAYARVVGILDRRGDDAGVLARIEQRLPHAMPDTELALRVDAIERAQATGRSAVALSHLAAALQISRDDACFGEAAERLAADCDDWATPIAAWEAAASALDGQIGALDLHARLLRWRQSSLADQTGAMQHVDAILAIEPNHPEALTAQVDLTDDPLTRADALSRLHAMCEDEAQRAAMALELGALHEGPLGDDGVAARWYDVVLADAPRSHVALEALARLHTAAEAWGPLRMVRLQQADVADGADRVALQVEAARLSERLEAPELALEDWLDVLALEPSNHEALSKARALKQLLRDWDSVAALGERLLETLEPTGAEWLDLQRGQARLYTERLERPERSIIAWEAVRQLLPDDNEALSALEGLYSQTGDLAGLVRVLPRLIAQTEPPDPQRWVVLGDTRERLLDHEGALAAFDMALGLEPHRAHALDRCLALDDDPRESLRRIELHLPHAEPSERARLRARAAADAEAAGRPAIALDHLAEAVRARGDDARFGPSAERLAQATDDWRTPLRAWQDAAAKVLGPGCIPLHRRAMHWARRLDDAGAARQHAEAILEHDPEAVDALELQVELAADEPTRQVDALRRLVPLTADAALRADRAAQLGALYAHRLSDPRAAARWYEAALAEASDRDDWLDALGQAWQSAGEEREVHGVLRRRAERATDEAQLALYLEAAHLAERLGLDEAAEADWTAVLVRRPAHIEALTAARGLAERRSDWARVVSLGDRLVEALPPRAPERRALLRAQARIHRERLQDPVAAARAWRALIEAEPADLAALETLEALYADLDDPEGLGWVIEVQVDLAPTPEKGLLLRLGDLRRQRLGDLRGALAAYDGALAADPFDREAFERACAACAALDDPEGQLQRVLARRARIEDPRESGHLLVRAARIAEPLGRPDQALELLSDAARITGDDAGLAPEVERLAALTGDWSTPAAGWRAAAGERHGSDALRLRERLLAWSDGPLSALDEVRLHARAILSVAPHHRPALVALRRTAASPAERADVLERLFELADEPDAKAELARELGGLYAVEIEDVDRAVRWFDVALGLRPTDHGVLAILASVHLEREAWAPLLSVRLRQARLSEGMARAAHLSEAARIAERIGRVPEAIDHWRAAIEAGAEPGPAWATLDALLTDQRRWRELAEVLVQRVEILSGAERRAARGRLAMLYTRYLEQPDAALQCWRAALAEDPSDEEAMWAALALSEGPPRAALRRRLVEHLPVGDARRLDLLRDLAREATAGGIARAWEAVLEVEAADIEALDALESHYAHVADWHGLSAILARRIGAPPTDLGRLQRLARLRDERLGDARGAIEAYDLLVVAAPENDVAFTRLVELLLSLGEVATAQARLERRAEAPGVDDATRVALLRHGARLAETRLNDVPRALGLISRAFRVSRDDIRFGPEAARLAALVGDWMVPVEAWRMVIDNIGEPSDAVPLHLRLATWAAGPMGESNLARAHYRAVLSIDPNHRDALRALAALSEDDPAARASALEGLLAAETEPETRRDLALRLGDLYAGPLAEPDRAVARFHAALAAAPDDVEALAGLARVHAARGAWSPLLAVRAQQVEKLPARARAEMRADMARLAERLDRVDEAIALWQQALREGADPAMCIDALDRVLSAHGYWRPLLQVLRMRIERGLADAAELRRVHARMARVFAEQLDDPAGAMDQWEAVLLLDPRDVDALRALRALAEAPAARVDVDRRLLAALPAEDADRLALQREIARVCGGELDRPGESVAAWRAVLQQMPGDTEALDALEALHEASDDPRALVDVLIARAETYPSTGLSLRIGGLWESLGASREALAVYRRVLDEVPEHAEAFTRARRLTLVDEDWLALVRLIEDRLNHLAEPAARRALADEAARVSEEQLGDLDAALRWVGEAFLTSRDDGAYGDELARLAEATGGWASAIGRYTSALAAVDGTPDAVPLHLRLAAWCAADRDRAVVELDRAAAIAPDDPAVLRARAELAERDGEHEHLLRSLIGLRRRADEEDARVALTRRIARLLAGPLDMPEAALAEYTRLMSDRPGDSEALLGRADLLRRLDDPAELYAALTELMERTPDPARRRDLLEERATLAERQGWLDEAIDAWRAVLAAEPETTAAWAALESLYATDGRLGALERLLIERAERAEGRAAAAFLVRAARVNERAGDADGCRALLERALQIDPDNPVALRALADAHAARGDVSAQARLEARLVTTLPGDAPETVERWRALGRLCQGSAGDPARAIEAWTAVRSQIPDDLEAIDALVELHAMVGDDPALADALADRAELEEEPARARTYARVAQIRENLGDVDGARAAWARVFASAPGDVVTFETLSRLHERAEDWSSLAEVLLGHADTQADRAARASLRLRASTLLAERAGRPGLALAARLAVFAEQPDDAEHGDAVERLARQAHDIESAAAAWTRAVERQLPVEAMVPLRMRLARWHVEWLDTPEEAIAHYCVILDRIPDHRDALTRMEEVRASIGDWSTVSALLQRQVAEASDAEQRITTLRRLGRVQARQPDARASAIATWRRVRRLADGDSEAAEMLVRLYRDGRKWPALVRLLEELPPTPDRLRTIARLAIDALDDRELAIGALERAREIDPHDLDTADALIEQYAAIGDWETLRALYVDQTRRRSPRGRLEIYRALARLIESSFDDALAAADAWQWVNRLDAADDEAIEALARLYPALGRADALAEAYARHIHARSIESSVSARSRLATLYAETLDDPYRAIEVLKPALDVTGAELPVARQLGALYATTGDWRYRVELLDREAAANVNAPREQGRLLKQAAALCETRLRDLDGAFGRLSAAWALDPDDREASAEVARLGHLQGEPAALEALYAERANGIAAREHRAQVLAAAAQLARGRGDGPAEERYWLRVLEECDPNSDEALDRLVGLRARAEDWAGLRTILATRVERQPSPERRLALAIVDAHRLERPDTAAQGLRQVLAETPGDRRALAELAGIERSRAAWPAVFEVLGRQLELTDEPAEQGRLLAEQAQLAADQLGRPDDAQRLWTAVLERRGADDAEALAGLDSLLSRGGDHEALVAVLHQRIAAGEPAAPLHTRLAHLAESRGERHAARTHWTALLELDPEREPAMWALLDLETEPAALDRLRVRLIARLPDSDPRRMTLQRARARVLAVEADRPAAIDAWRAVWSALPGDDEAIEALLGLYEAEQDLPALADLLVASGRDPMRAAALYVAVGRTRAAREIYEGVLAHQPAHGAASEALASIHEAALRWPALIAVLRGRADATAEPDARAALLARVAEVQVKRLDDHRSAFETTRERVELRPEQDAVERLEALAARTGQWSPFAETLEALLASKAADPVDLHRRLRDLYRLRLEQPSEARAHAEAIWSRAPEDDLNRQVLENLLEQSGELGALAELVAAHSERLPVERRRDRLAELARLHARRGAQGEAVAVWQDVLAARPMDGEALDALARHFSEADRQHELAALWKHRFEQARSSAERVEYARRLADLCCGPLDDPRRAVEPLQVAATETGQPALFDRLADVQLAAGEPDAALAARIEALRVVDAADGRARRLVALADRWALPQLEPWAELNRRWPADEDGWRRVIADLDASGRADDAARVRMLDSLRQAEQAAAAGDMDAARQHWRGALAADPDCQAALWAMVAHADDPDELDQLRTRLIETLRPDDPRRLEVTRARARALSGRGLYRDAVPVWQVVYDTSAEDDEAVDALLAAHEATGDREALADLLLETDRDPMRAAELYRAIGRSRAAEGIYRLALEADPRDSEAFEALATMHEAALRWTSLVDVLRARARVADTAEERIEVYGRIADTQSEQMHDPAGGFDTLRRAVLAHPEPVLLGRLEQLAERSDRRAELAEVLEAVLALEGLDRGAIHRQLRALYLDELGQPSAARRHAKALVRLEPETPAHQDELERILEAEGALGELAEVIAAHAERLSGDARRARLGQLAHLHARRGDRPAAIAVWQEILAAQPTDAEALEGLAEHYAHDDRLGELAAVLSRGFDRARTPDDRFEYAKRLADLCCGALGEPRRAIAPLQAVAAETGAPAAYDRLADIFDALGDLEGGLSTRLDAMGRVDEPMERGERLIALADRLSSGPINGWAVLWVRCPDDPEAWSAVTERLERDERWDDLAQVWTLEAKVEGDRSRWARLARLHELRRGDARSAITAWRAALDSTPGDVEALDALTRLDTARPHALADTLRTEMGRVDDPQRAAQIAVELAELAHTIGDMALLTEALETALSYRRCQIRLADQLAFVRATEDDWAGWLRVGLSVLDCVRKPDELAARHIALADGRRAHLGITEPWADVVAAVGDRPAIIDAVVDALVRADRWSDVEAVWRLDAQRRPAAELSPLAWYRFCRTPLAADHGARVREHLVEMYQGPLARAPHAPPFWQMLLEARPSDDEAFHALSRQFEAERDWAALGGLLALRAEAVPAEAVRRHRARARLFETHLADQASALEAWRAVRARAPGDEDALRALWLDDASDDERSALAADVLDRIPVGDPIRLEAHRWLARRGLGDVEEHWRAVLAEAPDDLEAADALETSSRAAEDWSAVRALLELRLRQADSAAAEAQIWREIATLEEQREQPGAARRAWLAVVQRLPGDPQAEAALAEACLADGDVEGWAQVRLEHLARTEAPAARLALYREVAEVLEARLPDPSPAFELIARAFAERPQDRWLAEELNRLGARSGRTDALIDALCTGLDRVEAADARRLALRIAELEAARGHSDAAAAAWRRALQVDPRCVPALDGLARHAEAQGDTAALAELLAARLRTRLEPSEAASRWRQLARLRRDAGDVDGATAAWQALLEHAPDDREALEARVSIERAAGHWPVVEGLLQRLIDRGDAELSDRQALAHVRYLYLDDPVGVRDALLPVADALEAPEALELLLVASTAVTDWSTVAETRGRLAGRVVGAAARDHWVEKARLERAVLDRPEAAMSSLAAALEVDPGYAPALEALWRLAESEARWPAAYKALTRLEAATTEAAVRAARSTRLGEIAELHLGDTAGAVDHYAQALDETPDYGPALRRLAERRLEAEQWASAADLLERLIEAEPEAESAERRAWLVSAGRCAEALGDDGRARRRYEAALVLDSTRIDALAPLADLTHRQGDWGRAFKLGRTLLTHHGESMEAAERAGRLHRLGTLKAIMGESEQARSWYEKALSVNPEHRDARAALAMLDALDSDGAPVAPSPADAPFPPLPGRSPARPPVIEPVPVPVDSLVPPQVDWGPGRVTGSYPALAFEGAAEAPGRPGKPTTARYGAFSVDVPPVEPPASPPRLPVGPPAPPPLPADGVEASAEAIEFIDAIELDEDGLDEDGLDESGLEFVDDSAPSASMSAVAPASANAAPSASMAPPSGSATEAQSASVGPQMQAVVEAAVIATLEAVTLDGLRERRDEDGALLPPPTGEIARSILAAAAANVTASSASLSGAEPSPEPVPEPPMEEALGLPLADVVRLQPPRFVDDDVPLSRDEGSDATKPPARAIRAGRLRVVRRPSKRRRWILMGSVASLAFAGVLGGLLMLQTWRLEASDQEKARLARVSNRLAEKVSETQQRFAEMTRELKGEPAVGDERRMVAGLVDDDGVPLDETMLELAFRDLEMREQLGAVQTLLAESSAERGDEVRRSAELEGQVAALQARIADLQSQQSEVHERLAGRVDQNIGAIETALSATGLDINSLLDPKRGGTPLAVPGGEEPALTGVGGPFIADGTNDYVNPIPGETEVMSGFGPRGHSHHNGIDIPAPIGTAVLAVASGEIIHLQNRAAWQGRPKWIEKGGRKIKSPGWRAGIYVELRQDDGRISRYMHLSALAPDLSVGRRIQKGQVLGSVGRTGVEQSETHLHFELREPPGKGESRFGAALDPTAAVHADDADVIAGTSLLHADPQDLDPQLRARMAAQVPAAGAGEGIIGRLDTRMDRLQSLEKLLREMPLIAPVDDFKVSSPYGRRLDPIEGRWGQHDGIDIPGRPGDAIRATAPGKVVFSGQAGRYGVMVEIDHGNGITTRYGHLLRSLVRPGQRVTYRERIGEMGSSGRSTGTHVHYEIRVDDKPRDPMNFIQAGRYVFKR